MFEKCPYCNSSNIGIGYQLGNARIFADQYAYFSSADCSEVEYLICKDCGSILHARVVRPEVFHHADQARQKELLGFIEEHGILLCNESRELPSLGGLGYDMENVMGLIDLHRIFYCMLYKKRSTFLSGQAYFLLKRCKRYPEMDQNSRLVFDAAKKLDVSEKGDIKEKTGMDKKEFDRCFRFLLENLYLTAFSGGKQLGSNWYSYRYCTADRWEKEVHGLHFSGDARNALADLFGKAGMGPKEIERLCR